MKAVTDHRFVKTKANAMTSEGIYVAGADATACVKSTGFNMRKAGYSVRVISDSNTGYNM